MFRRNALKELCQNLLTGYNDPMRYRFFTNSEKTWRAMFQAIEEAIESVYIEMFILADDMSEFNFIKLLKEKAKAGLRVRIILDALGSRDLSKKAITELREAGAELFFISQFFHHNHRKILVLDQRVAFLGGVNLHQSSKYWNDLAIKVRGRLVKYILRSFARSYARCGGKDPEILKTRRKVFFNKMHSWLMEHFPLGKSFTLKKIYKEHLEKVEKNVLLATPYFMPKRWLISLLDQAVLRGVKVEILMPQYTDARILDRINFFFINRVSKLGVKFYLEPKMNHAKFLILDQKEGIVGSQNLDFLSFDYNDEIGIFLKDLQTVQKLSKIAEEWKKEAILFDPKNYKPKFLDYLLYPIIRFFAKFI